MAPSLEDILARSSELAREGRHEQHLALMRSALAQHPDEPEIVIRAASAHLAEAPDEAAELAGRAVALAPEDASMLTRAAGVMLATERLDEARDMCGQASRSAGEGFVLAFDLAHLAGRVALGYGNEEKALELLQLAFDNQPETIGHASALADLLERRGEHARALEVLERAIRHRPDDRMLDSRRVQLRVALHGLDALPPGYTAGTME